MSGATRIRALVRAGELDQLRRPLAVVLPAALPVYVVTRSVSQTLATPRAVDLAGGDHVVATMRALHGAGMAAIAVAFVSALMGIFAARSARSGDPRLALTGYRPAELIGARLAVLLSSATFVTVVAATAAAAAVHLEHPVWFAASLWLAAVLFALLGALLGTALGVLAATYAALFGVLIDVGIVENPMFNSAPPSWAVALPGWASARALYAAGFSARLTATGELLLAVGWVLAAAVAVVVVMRRALPPGIPSPLMKGAHGAR